MIRANAGRRGWWGALAGCLALVLALSGSASAQSTGMVKGKVVDGQNNVVTDAKVVIEYKDGINRKFETKTNKKGEYIQIGLQPGNYAITASKDGVGTATKSTRVAIGASEQIDLTLAAAGAAAAGGEMSKEEAQKLQAFKKAFEDGLAESQKGNHDGAIAKFGEALTMRPDCYACQYNVAGSHAQKKEYEKAEAGYLAAAKLDANNPEPYNALANLYNTQKQFDKAAAMTAEATKRAGGATGGAGGSAETLYNQGVILWNAGKIAEAKTQFEAAVKAKPDYADAHYQLGMANLNEGKLPEAAIAFEKYVELAPTGQYAEQAKGILGQIKPK